MVASGVVQFAIAEASVEEIDRLNILQATFLAMRRALAALAEPPVLALPDVVLVDGNRAPPGLACRAETIVGGDAHSYSIAAASIFAKVARDQPHDQARRGLSRLRLGAQPRLRQRAAPGSPETSRADPASPYELRAPQQASLRAWASDQSATSTT